MNESSVFSAMQEGVPYRTYRKTILGKVSVKLLDPFKVDQGIAMEIILQGNPKDNSEGCFVDVWSVKEDIYFQRMNVNHLKNGVLIPHDRTKNPVEVDVNPFNVLTDDELYDLLNSPFFKLQDALNKMTSPAPIHRLLEIANSEEKSAKIIKHLESRLSEVQEQELLSTE